MIEWNDRTRLTRSEFDSFINAAVPFLKDMEEDNGWDFFVNDTSVAWFCERFILKAFELNDYEDYQRFYPKVKDMNTIYDLLVNADWSHEDATLRKNKETKIWQLVLNRVNSVADTVLR